MKRVLAVRLDSMGDVLLAGPAVRALAHTADRLTLLVGPKGRAAAELLPCVDEVLEWACPWIDFDAPPVDRAEVEGLVEQLTDRFDRAVVFTSFHQSALPTALLLRMAGVPWIGAFSEDFPGKLLDLRMRPEVGIPEPERALSLALAAGGELPPGDTGRLAVRTGGRMPSRAGVDRQRSRSVVLHPGTSAPARAWPLERYVETARLLSAAGWRTVVTGTTAERELARPIIEAVTDAVDLTGRTQLADLARILNRAQAVVCGNTGTAHLAAAVGTPVVSLFAPTVPASQWAPYGVPHVLLGDQSAPCAGTRALECPVPGHPCLAGVDAATVVDAVHSLVHSTDPLTEAS